MYFLLIKIGVNISIILKIKKRILVDDQLLQSTNYRHQI